MAGVPFDVVEKLAPPPTGAAAREILVTQVEFVGCLLEVERFLQSHGRELSKELFRAWRKTIRQGAPPPPQPAFGVFESCRNSKDKLSEAETRLDDCLRQELNQARSALLRSAGKILPAYLVFAQT